MRKKFMSMTFKLLIDWWNNWVKNIKVTYHSAAWLCFDKIIYDTYGDKIMNIPSGEFLIERGWC